jgi:hypothetical protein
MNMKKKENVLSVELLENNAVQVSVAVKVESGGIVVKQHTISSGDDYSNESDYVKEMCNAHF